MDVLKEIQTWASALPPWQQDALLRLLLKGHLDAADDLDLYALLKSAHGIPDSEGRIARVFDLGTGHPASTTAPVVRLAAIRKLSHVNALAPDQVLTLIPDGLTVVYGDNGSGKSGYSRVLKRACAARDQTEPILPNARVVQSKRTIAGATFDLLVDGQAEAVDWTDGASASLQLSAIAIFDSRCARAFLDDQGELTYTPYGSHLLGDLARACLRLNQMRLAELGPAVDLRAFAPIANSPTVVGRVIKGLSSRTDPRLITAMATLDPVALEKYAVLETSLKTENPAQKALHLRLLADRLAKLSARCVEKVAFVGDAGAQKLRALVTASNDAKTAAAIAAKQFKETQGLLPGTGGEAWELLFEAARKFALESHPGRSFPALGAESPCPLCQQPLNEGNTRLISFDAFINHELEKTARDKRGVAANAYRALEKADLDIGLDPELKTELGALDLLLAKACEDYQAQALGQRRAIMEACAGKATWDAVGPMPANPAARLSALAATLRTQAVAMERAGDQKKRAALQAEFDALSARKQLSSVKEAVLDAHSRLVLQAKLHSCVVALRTQPISLKATELNHQVASKELAAALNVEFKDLGASNLRVSTRSFAERGRTYYKLVMELPGEQRPAAILSEGEQRAVAIASFLAEIGLGSDKGVMVFDDPVSSLDHRRRELVATRLAKEVKEKGRQLIVFTHDIYFLPCVPT